MKVFPPSKIFQCHINHERTKFCINLQSSVVSLGIRLLLCPESGGVGGFSFPFATRLAAAAEEVEEHCVYCLAAGANRQEHEWPQMRTDAGRGPDSSSFLPSPVLPAEGEHWRDLRRAQHGQLVSLASQQC